MGRALAALELLAESPELRELVPVLRPKVAAAVVSLGPALCAPSDALDAALREAQTAAALAACWKVAREGLAGDEVVYAARLEAQRAFAVRRSARQRGRE